MLGELDPLRGPHRDRFIHEIQRGIDDPHASQEERQWAECYKYSIPTAAIP